MKKRYIFIFIFFILVVDYIIEMPPTPKFYEYEIKYEPVLRFSHEYRTNLYKIYYSSRGKFIKEECIDTLYEEKDFLKYNIIAGKRYKIEENK